MSFDATFDFTTLETKTNVNFSIIHTIFPQLIENDVPGSLTHQKKELTKIIPRIDIIKNMSSVDKATLYNNYCMYEDLPHIFMAKMCECDEECLNSHISHGVDINEDHPVNNMVATLMNPPQIN